MIYVYMQIRDKVMVQIEVGFSLNFVQHLMNDQTKWLLPTKHFFFFIFSL